MKITGNTVLITGGATGIGFGLAEKYIKAGNEVIICGRREDRLKEAQTKLPGLHTRFCDLTKIEQQKALVEWTISNFPNFNILINNAGIQQPVNFINNNTSALFEPSCEIDINLTAPLRLTALFVPHLLKQKDAAIMNVSSGLGFVPLAMMPVYCATKAALHSFSLSLRHQLEKTSIKVFELIPPMVDTELGSSSRDKRGLTYRGISPEEYATETFKGIVNDVFEIPVGTAVNLVDNSKFAFEGLNSHH